MLGNAECAVLKIIYKKNVLSGGGRGAGGTGGTGRVRRGSEGGYQVQDHIGLGENDSTIPFGNLT